MTGVSLSGAQTPFDGHHYATDGSSLAGAVASGAAVWTPNVSQIDVGHPGGVADGYLTVIDIARGTLGGRFSVDIMFDVAGSWTGVTRFGVGKVLAGARYGFYAEPFGPSNIIVGYTDGLGFDTIILNPAATVVGDWTTLTIDWAAGNLARGNWGGVDLGYANTLELGDPGGLQLWIKNAWDSSLVSVRNIDVTTTSEIGPVL